LHITLRVLRDVPALRAHELFLEVRRALAAGRDRFGFRLIHFSVQRDHLHLLAEAADQRALSRGLQGLSIRVAKAVNRPLHRHGKVFADRYHSRALKTPRAARWALRYVLLNVRKHEPRAVPFGFVDACSSAAWFDGFARPAELVFGARECREQFRIRHGLDAPVVAARTWLLTVGQCRAPPFDVDDVPSAARRIPHTSRRRRALERGASAQTPPSE
jgi:REP element-mobilizing transposase RayT